MNNTKLIIDEAIKQITTNNNKFDFKSINDMYKLGKILTDKIPDLKQQRKQKTKSGFEVHFDYVSWKWYEYILKKFDNEFWWELVDWSENYQMVKCEINWLNKKWSAWYGVETPTHERDNLGEKLVNENMRCFAKLASRATGLFFHLWIEGKND